MYSFTKAKPLLSHSSFLNTSMRHGRTVPCSLKILMTKPWLGFGQNLSMKRNFVCICATAV
ncbi:hypothetical protein DITRI_Ditri04bG0200000 [Diplodiscus trichospermus]